MVTFDWFTFRPINLAEFSSHFKKGTSQAQGWYSYWSNEYNHLAERFYEEQYARHKLLEFREFSRTYSLTTKYPEELFDLSDPDQYIESWNLWVKQARLLQNHRETIEPLLQEHSIPRETSNPGDFKREYYQILNSGWTEEKMQASKELWFNLNITRPSDSDLEHLKAMPYGQYLKTRHWRKVRAAMFLIEQARCLACDIFADSFYGGDWETELQVHHLHYKNRGYERYKDLQLLCTEHHNEAHAKRN